MAASVHRFGQGVEENREALWPSMHQREFPRSRCGVEACVDQQAVNAALCWTLALGTP